MTFTRSYGFLLRLTGHHPECAALVCWEDSSCANGLPQRNQWRVCHQFPACCIAEQPQPKRRRRIDRSMIGEPTNFVHTTHVGSGDMGLGLASVDLVQAQMKSKGGYAHGGSEGSQL
ncbi:CDC42 small effector protein 2 [Lates japonicus]|uniref:CDC42 small effector protein 2 n=1 Tax=Lates japonicus TaxID=270547 RepID=A0AAD3MNG8_LATJO|nr:CDC42 small effector protein 2 [Lates japonicus]